MNSSYLQFRKRRQPGTGAHMSKNTRRFSESRFHNFRKTFRESSVQFNLVSTFPEYFHRMENFYR